MRAHTRQRTAVQCTHARTHARTPARPPARPHKSQARGSSRRRTCVKGLSWFARGEERGAENGYPTVRAAPAG